MMEFGHIVSHVPNENYRDNWDRIFVKQADQPAVTAEPLPKVEAPDWVVEINNPFVQALKNIADMKTSVVMAESPNDLLDLGLGMIAIAEAALCK